MQRRDFIKLSTTASLLATASAASGLAQESASGQTGFKLNYAPHFGMFRHIHSKGFKGIVGMEHGNSIDGKKGEQAVIDAYRAADAF